MKLTLRLAAIYNILWGAWVVIFPNHFFSLIGISPLNHMLIWQGMGMVIGVYGLGYWWAAADPLRHWPIVAVGFLGKVLGPVGFIYQYASGNIPFEFFYMLLTNDFIWWIPFLIILKKVHVQYKWKLSDETIS
ncbi:MAG TPA: alkyl hydroperoxide reductase [Bacteroidales bacterium]|nr:alkyl hydroperoxide reductase [Bacteroidales bacterium]